MKKLSILASTLLLGGIFIFVSCSKTGPAGPAGQNGATGPAGPLLYGNITGNVIMANQYGAAVTNAYTNGYILLKNSSTNATVDSVFANSSGAYTISNIPTGTYNMYAIYSGYGMSETLNIVITTNTRPYDIKLAAIPNFNVNMAVDSIGLVKRDTNYAYVSGTIAQDNNGERTILLFVGNTTTTSSSPGSYLFIQTTTVPPGATTYSFAIPLLTIYNNGFTYGNPIYFAVYGAANDYDYGDYTNYTYGQLTYTAISANMVNAAPSPLSLPLH